MKIYNIFNYGENNEWILLASTLSEDVAKAMVANKSDGDDMFYKEFVATDVVYNHIYAIKKEVTLYWSGSGWTQDSSQAKEFGSRDEASDERCKLGINREDTEIYIHEVVEIR